MIGEMNKALRFLCAKYGVQEGEMVDSEGKVKVRLPDGTEARLLPWRTERRFIELKNLIRNGTLEEVSTLRFASTTAGGDLGKQLGKELDLAVWILEKKIRSLFAVCAPDCSAANVIVKMENEVNVSVECGNRLPKGKETMDRHEIIARRGIASDRVVDTQVPQSSIYSYTDSGETRYTDTDSELFGLPEEEILLVRAAFAVLSDPGLAAVWNAAAADMERFSEAVFESDRTQSVVTF